jgi:hypothetical protein
MARTSPTLPEVLVISLLALLLYLHLFGWATLDPRQFTWMLHNDSAQHYLGWQFFRSEPWQWPPGRISGFGISGGSNIVFTDSIPLLALFLKPFSGWLAAQFQYFGLWILSCYLLSGYFGLRLLARYTRDPALRLAGACFFILSPPLLLRGYGHESLMAHWLLLAGIDTCLDGWNWRRWLSWSAIAALCHPYLLLMVLGLMAASATSAVWIDKTLRPTVLLLQGIGISLVLLLLMGLAGHFSNSGPLHAEGYGYFNMNILSLLDPLLGWSRYLRQRPVHPDYANLGNFGQYEGFLYLGAGMIVLAIMALALHLMRPQPLAQRYWPLAAVGLLYWLLALSNVISFAELRLFTLPLPDALYRALSIFRASGRLGWPAFYLIHLGVLLLVLHHLPTRSALAVLLAALALQLADQSDKHREFRGLIRQRMAWTSPLQSPQWNTLAQRADALVIVSPLPDMTQAYIPYAELAARYRLATNAANIAHAGTQGVASYGASVAVALENSQYDPRSIYVFLQPDAAHRLPPAWQPHLLTLDGVLLLPPGLPLP